MIDDPSSLNKHGPVTWASPRTIPVRPRMGAGYAIIGTQLAVALIAAGVIGWVGVPDHVDFPSTLTGAVRGQRQPIGVDALPVLPPPGLLRPLTAQDAKAANDKRPVLAVKKEPAAAFRLSGTPFSRLRAIDCLAHAVYYEAASEGVEGGQAVAQVVLNRVQHAGYPNTVCGTVYQSSDRPTGCQFTFTCDGSLARVPAPYLWARSRRIAAEALAGRVFAGVGRATHYHADYVLPYWADSLDKVAVIGRHVFYRLLGSSGSRRAFTQSYAGAEPVPSPNPAAEAVPSPVIPLTGAMTIAPLPEPKVEEDRIVALAAGPATPKRIGLPLKADLERGQLISEDQMPDGRTKAKAIKDTGSTGAVRLKPLGADDLRVASQRVGG